MFHLLCFFGLGHLSFPAEAPLTWRIETLLWLVVWMRSQSTKGVACLCVLNDDIEFRFTEIIFGWF